jgi:hypothetical protein
MDAIADWAVYLVPPEDYPLYQACAAVLGSDCRREAPVERPRLPGIPAEVLAEWVGRAANYGPHATISGWLRVPVRHRDQILDDLSRIARTLAPIRMERADFRCRVISGTRALRQFSCW